MVYPTPIHTTPIRRTLPQHTFGKIVYINCEWEKIITAQDVMDQNDKCYVRM
jgi:hypothetical protein